MRPRHTFSSKERPIGMHFSAPKEVYYEAKRFKFSAGLFIILVQTTNDGTPLLLQSSEITSVVSPCSSHNLQSGCFLLKYHNQNHTLRRHYLRREDHFLPDPD
ncbi:hypothetical protein J6590_055513 [Homalodisca vitripennis]|nr:hypothetical protein J6590_055513 [Homalodisca vitripennis]